MMKLEAASVGSLGPLTAPAPVLVIDDQPADVATTLGRLAEAGYSAVAESNGDAVLRLVRADLMRFVVSELYVPCAEGTCVVAALKRDRTRLPRLRVLAHSRHTTPSDDAWALAAGCVLLFSHLESAFLDLYVRSDKKESWLAHPTLDAGRHFSR